MNETSLVSFNHMSDRNLNMWLELSKHKEWTEIEYMIKDIKQGRMKYE
ncbi:MAG: hypothetical protein ACOCT9_00970 [archaeon]